MRIQLIAAALLSAAVVAVPAHAATNPKSKAKTAEKSQQPAIQAREQGWMAKCSSSSRGDKPDCAVNQRVVLANTNQLLAAITIQVPSKTRKPVLMLQAPTGIYLPPGIRLTVDKEKPVTVPLQTCDNNGCYAGQPLSADLLKKLQKGKKLNFSFQNMGRREISVNMSLEGFGTAYEKAK